MTVLLTSAQMRGIERAAIESGAVLGLQLMERAGRGAVAAALAHWPELDAGMHRALVLCGPGNNGGDGYVIARCLADRGWHVTVLALGRPGAGAPDAARNHTLWAALGAVGPLDAAAVTAAIGAAAQAAGGGGAGCGAAGIAAADVEGEAAGGVPILVVDAVFGTGLQRPVGAGLAAALAAARPARWRLAVDAPSGLCLDSGRGLIETAAAGARVRAAVPDAGEGAGGEREGHASARVPAGRSAGPVPAWAQAPVLDHAPASGSDFDGDETSVPLPALLTVSFHAAKCGHYLASGPAACGALRLVDIGLPAGPVPAAGAAAGGTVAPGADVDADANAGADAIAGDDAAMGIRPARLCEPAIARLTKQPGAHKYGHGHLMVLAGGPGRGGAARLAARAGLRIGAGLVTVAPPPEALTENAARLDAVMLAPLAGPDGLAALMRDPRISALCLGPGLGLDRARALVPVALAARRPAVLDADALSAFDEAPGALFAALHEAAVLTPHLGEFARLFPDLAAALAKPPERGPAVSRLDAVRAAAARAGCVVLLKGPDTVIATPGGEVVLNAASRERAAPWLATAGAGDVLAGMIAGLMARGLPPVMAAETAAWLHVEAARSVGPGLIAEDLPDALPACLRALGL